MDEGVGTRLHPLGLAQVRADRRRYQALQSLHAEWVPERTWVYRTTFDIPRSWESRRTFLCFEGIDYEAQVYVDGERVGTTASLFVPAWFELHLGAGPHTLAVAIDPKPRWRRRRHGGK